MRKLLMNNLPLKLMSVVAAVFIWLIVVNVDNPTIKASFDVPVTVQNESYVEKDGKMCLLEEGQETTRVTVTGRRKTVERLRASDIVATADLRQAVSLNTNPVMVPIAVSCRGITSENLVARPQNISIEMDDRLTQEFMVSVSTGDSTPGKGYEIGTKIVNPEKVRITGAASLIKKIDRVVAYVNVNGQTSDVSQQADLKIIDKNQDEVSESQMRYLKYDLTSPKVTATVKLWKVKTNVNIQAEYSGYPAEGYQVGGLTLTPSTVSVTGTEEALDALEEQNNTIWIPASQVDVSGESQDCEREVNLSELLPQTGNLRLAADTNDKVIVKVSILPAGSKAYKIPTTEIQVKNVPADMEAVFETAEVELRVSKETEDLGDLEEKDIKVSIDVSGKKAGTYELPLEVSLPEGYELVSQAKTEVRLASIQEVQQEEN